MSASEEILSDRESPAAPPRLNGELVFEEPWESRAFGMVVALSETGAVDFEEFRARLVEEIRRDDDRSYYERWLAVLARALLERGTIRPAELRAREADLEREWSHDHAGHRHDH